MKETETQTRSKPHRVNPRRPRRLRHLGPRWGEAEVVKLYKEPTINHLYQKIPTLVDHDSNDPYAPQNEIALNGDEVWDLSELMGKEKVTRPTQEQVSRDTGLVLRPAEESSENETPALADEIDVFKPKGGEHTNYIAEDGSFVKVENIPVLPKELESRIPINRLYRTLLRLKGFEESLPEMTKSESHKIDGTKNDYYTYFRQTGVPEDENPEDTLNKIHSGKIKLYRFRDAYKVLTDAGIPFEGDFRRGSNYKMLLKEVTDEETGEQVKEAHEVFIDGLFMEAQELLQIETLVRINQLLVATKATKEDQLEVGRTVLELIKIERKYANTAKEKGNINSLIHRLQIKDIVPPIPVAPEVKSAEEIQAVA